MHDKIQRFFSSKAFLVAGGSTKRETFGNKCITALKMQNRQVFPIHPVDPRIVDLPAFKSIATAVTQSGVEPKDIAFSIVTPPPVTLELVQESLKLGIRRFWMQPGAENQDAIFLIEHTPGGEVLHGGVCLLVEIGNAKL